MKRILSLVFLSAMLVACGGGSGGSDNPPPPVSADPNSVTTPIYGIFDEVQYRNFVKKYDELNPGQLVLPEGQTIDSIPLNDLVIIMSNLLKGMETPPETI